MEFLRCRKPLCALGLWLLTTVCAAASDRDRLILFDIPPLPLEESLARYRALTGLYLSIPDEIPGRRMASEVRGPLTAQAAIEQLVAPFDIKAVFQSSNKVVLVRGDDPAARHGDGGDHRGCSRSDGRRLQHPQHRSAANRRRCGRVHRLQQGCVGPQRCNRCALVPDEQLPACSPRGVSMGPGAINATLGRITIRGLPPSETIILFDGHRRADSYAGGDIQQPDVAAIPIRFCRASMCRTAAASALFGADATAGAINLVRDRKSPRTRFFARTEEVSGASSSSQQFGAERRSHGKRMVRRRRVLFT